MVQKIMNFFEKKRSLFLFMSFFITLTPIHALDEFYTRHREGWFWYEESPTEEALPPEKRQNSSPSESENINLDNALERLHELRERIERTRALAVLKPTGENVLNYMRLQKEIVQKSYEFQSQWQKEILLNPELDHELTSPSSAPARLLAQQESLEKRSLALIKLANSHILLLFTQPHCKACELMTKTLESLKDIFTIIEVEGAPYPSKQGTFLYQDLKNPYPIQHTPTLVAFNPRTETYIPICVGIRSLDKVMQYLADVPYDA